MASDFECNLKLSKPTKDGGRNKTNKAWDARASKSEFSMGQWERVPFFLELYEGGFISCLTTLEVSGGCVW